MSLNSYHILGRIIFCLCIVHLTNESRKEPEIIVKLNSVTSFPGLEAFYQELRDESVGFFRRITTGIGATLHNPTSPLDTSTKSELCKHIFSDSFHFAEETLINPEEVRQDLKENYRRIFWSIFRTKVKTTWFKRIYRYEYANDSHPRNIFVAGAEYDEEVFSCLVRDREPPYGIKQYFVSHHEYDVTETGEFYVIGRFVFVEQRRRLVVHALAEQPAVTNKSESSTNQNELDYLLKRAIDSPALNPEDDPICVLSKAKKLRLCTSVLSGLRLEWTGHEVKFFPDIYNVEHMCRNKIVSVLSASLDPDTDEYSEWVIGCKATEDNQQMTYYISQAYESNEVMVFSSGQGDRVNVHHISRRAGVITKGPDPKRGSDSDDLCTRCRHEQSEDSSDSDSD